MYYYMKAKHGNKFPIKVNGRPYLTKWIVRVEMDEEMVKGAHEWI
jgi:glycine cleavage system H lipoate-binding protein